MKRQSIGVGLMGIGVIGGQVTRVLTDTTRDISADVGCPIVLKKIKVIPPDMERPQVKTMNPKLFTTDEDAFFNEPGIDIIIEVIGGEQPAFDYLKRAMTTGRSVVTSNKEVIAKRGAELRALSQKNNVNLRYGASVGGGIPLVAPFMFELVANRLTSIHAIVNGTTNFILTRMEKDGMEFTAALKEAQRLGYAEPDPRNDIEGIDASYKIAILATLASHSHVKPDDVYHEGISRLTSHDFKYARELGYAIKLLAIAKNENGAIEARVHPVFVPEDSMIASVNDVFNAILVEGDLVGPVMFYGRGAGPYPTSSNVVADVVAEAQDIIAGVGCRSKWIMQTETAIKPMSEIESRYYLRLNVADRPGVLAQISKVLGDDNISIASVIQKETDNAAQTAELVIMTHMAKEKAMQKALTELKGLSVVKEIGNFVRVES